MRRLLVVVAALFALSGVTQAEPATRPTSRPVKITVLDTADKPIANAMIKPDGKKDKDAVRTAADGSAEVIVDPNDDTVYLHLSADGHAPKRLIWSKYNDNADAKPENIPAAVTVRLEDALPIGGKVVDDAGQPVGGATVVLQIYDKSGRRAVESLDISYATIKTLADGTWTYSTAPPKFENILVGVRHPDYLSGTGNNGFFPMLDVKDIATLRDKTHTDTLIRGVILEGTVFGVDGKPLAKAKVGIGSDRVASNVLPDVKTDENGKYHIPIDPAVQAVLTVRAKGHSPATKTLTVTKPTTLDFHLEPAKTIRGRVVDPDGKPVAGAYVYFDEWQGLRTIEHSERTDKDGFFNWKEAPAEKVKADVDAMGFARERDVWLTPSKDENDVTLVKIHRPAKITGTVVDAETGEPIKAFKVVVGIWFSDQQAIAWQRRGDDDRRGADGKFDLNLRWPYPGHKVLIEADGYLPGESRVFKNDEQQVTLEIKLTRGEGYKGTVRDVAGKPVKAKLVIATPATGAYLMNGTEYNDQGNVTCDVGDDGAYSLPAQTGQWTIVAFSNAGYAEVTPEQIAKSKDITLQPWGRVEGVAMIGSKPAAGAELQIYDNRPYDDKAPRIFHQQGATADKDGKFHFDRVRPGDIFVSRTVRQAMLSTSTSPVKGTVKPGETVRVAVGGKGRPVVGRVQLPAELSARDDWQYGMCMMQVKLDYPKPPSVPDDVKGDIEKTQAWYQAWVKSPEGEAYQAAVKKMSESSRSYPIIVDPNGSFRADDVEPGVYSLDIQIAERPKERTCGFGESIATGALKFTVAEMPNGRSDEVQDVGTVEVQVLKTLKVGDVAPPIAGKLLDGQDFTLESLKGKYVVLDFWATWCGPCVAEIPNMKSTYAAFAKNDKFAMVSISMDEEAATAKKFTEKQQMAWTQVHLPGVWENKAAKDYGVRGIPSIWLIGPDGKVLAKDLRGEGVKQAIEKYMTK